MKSYLDDASEAWEVVERTHVPYNSIWNHFWLVKLGWNGAKMGLGPIFNKEKSAHALIECAH